MTVITRRLLSLLALALFAGSAARAEPGSCSQPLDVCISHVEGAFPLILEGRPIRVIVDDEDWPGVKKVASNLTTDLSALAKSEETAEENTAVLVGTIGRSPVIDALVARGALDVSDIDGVWEGYVQAIVDEPAEGISRALVIAGADKRGTIYGIYDLAERAGVSPWSWWADVPAPYRPDLSVLPGRRSDWPRVKYRGIFINDEKPALHGWANHHYGGFKSAFYERAFELILRHKGNYLWPAMWGEAIYDDDPLTGPLADEMGIVLGTSHHEPMGRAHVEWARYGEGKWDYLQNAEVLQQFWRAGMERMKNWEVITTLGMRGDGDEAMTEGTAIALLERIVRDQRQIIAEVAGDPVSQRPTIWALYKEVQDYYDQGMQVPDDITLLFADDNWGNIRRLPNSESERPGGYGVYYHFDYVGGPRNYKWLNTNQIERTWEQMRRAWDQGAREIWIVNVGDIKPMEFPISFFLDQAWDPDRMGVDQLGDYTRVWAAQQFGEAHADDIAGILKAYTKYASRRKHELVDPSTFSLVNFDEFGRVTRELEKLAVQADAIRETLPAGYDDAYVQLVWFPVHATWNLYQLYEAAALNGLYAQRGRVADALVQAQRTEAFFERDAELARIYHEDVAGGKWVHMMSQTHIGYTYWQQPEEQVMPDVVQPVLPKKSKLGVAVEGRRASSRMGDNDVALPLSDVFSRHAQWIEVFSTGTSPVKARIKAKEDWIVIEEGTHTVDDTRRLSVAVDWDRLPAGRHTGTIEVKSGFWRRLKIRVPVFKPEVWESVSGWALASSYGALEAAAADRKIDGAGLSWVTLSNLGRSGDGLTLFAAATPAPATETPPEGAPRLEYDVHLFEAKPLTVTVELAPTLDFLDQGGMKFALSLGEGDPVVVNVHERLRPADWDERHWEEIVARNAHRITLTLPVQAAGPQTLTLSTTDAPLVFQRLILSQTDLPDSYLGPPLMKRSVPGHSQNREE